MRCQRIHGYHQSHRLFQTALLTRCTQHRIVGTCERAVCTELAVRGFAFFISNLPVGHGWHLLLQIAGSPVYPVGQSLTLVHLYDPNPTRTDQQHKLSMRCQRIHGYHQSHRLFQTALLDKVYTTQNCGTCERAVCTELAVRGFAFFILKLTCWSWLYFVAGKSLPL